MNRLLIKSLAPAMLSIFCLLIAPRASAATFNMRAASYTKTVNGRQVLMWGFAIGNGAPTSPGPALTVSVADTQLIINLKNELNVPVSLVIPGQNGFVRDASHTTFEDAFGRTRARSFVKETQPGQTVQYVWKNVSAGTYLYHSGSHPALQVQMGLYGLLRKNFTNTRPLSQAYEGVPYFFTREKVWVFGEIDFDVHDAVRDGTYGTTVKSMIHSTPDVYLLNGEPFITTSVSGGPQGATLIRMLNACYDERIPVVNGTHLKIVAEDGRKYSYPKLENAVNLPALKTRDALLETASSSPLTVYDRRSLSRQ
ncbi:MAG: multicopper oxidase domain-containing protein [Verrucomicrobia bacterium]|nr:multicopper oxidase domain-containing protein [Verrucomicrobiota bacterium]